MKNTIRYLLGLVIIVLAFSCDPDPTDDPSNNSPNLTISDVTAFEGDDADRAFSFPVRLDKVSVNEVSFSYTTKDISATAGHDYEMESGTAVIPAGELEVKIEIPILVDTLLEQDNAFEVIISNAANATIIDGTGIGTIRNDDTTPGEVTDEGYSTPLSYPGLTLVWSDEFTGSSLNTGDWTYETGASGWGNNELQNYQNGTNNATVQNGYLIIEAKKTGSNYTSARIITKDKQAFKYGRIDIRARLPQGQGIWPALWMLGENFSSVGWPSCGEIDIMELVGHQPNKVYGTAHWDNAGSHADYGGNRSLSSGIFADEFHVFSIIWNSQEIKWLLDDQQYHNMDTSPGNLSEFQENSFSSLI